MRTKKLQRSPLRLLNKIDVRPHTWSQGAESKRHRQLIRNIENYNLTQKKRKGANTDVAETPWHIATTDQW